MNKCTDFKNSLILCNKLSSLMEGLETCGLPIQLNTQLPQLRKHSSSRNNNINKTE